MYLSIGDIPRPVPSPSLRRPIAPVAPGGIARDARDNCVS
jgi:hypothetical protein